MKPNIALVTAAAARDQDEDLAPLADALRAKDISVHIVNWDDASADWSAFDLALLRSTWDYTMRFAEFIAWAKRAGEQTLLLNRLPVIGWNTDKHYLAELATAGVPVVPSVFVEPGEDAALALAQFLRAHAAAEFVVKPAIGAGSRDAQRYARGQVADAQAHVQRLLDTQRSVLLQPYLDRVDEHGETALVFFGGVFSHAIRKGPLLRPNEGPTRALFALEHISPRTPTAEEMQVALRTLKAIPFDQPLLYARVDLLHADHGGTADGTPQVLELELTEPSLFFAHAPGSAERFVAAIMQRLPTR
jgi:glutathione synthase/RimK-type ligase-like ATP-grasp enzyme